MPITRSRPQPKRAIILDRDGTLVVDHGYLDDPERLEFLPGAAQALRQFSEWGHRIVILTNQSAVGRGRLTLERMHEINQRLIRMVKEAGGRVDGLYSCPHRPQDACECRKPQTRLLLDAAARLGFEPSHSVVIGDKSSDIALGRAVQAITMQVCLDGHPADGDAQPDFVVRDLLEAAQLVASLEASNSAPAAGGGR